MGANASHHEPLGDYHSGRHRSSQGAGPSSSHHRSSFRKSLKKKKREKYEHKDREDNKENHTEDGTSGGRDSQHHPKVVEGASGSRERRMDRLRRSFRESFRKKKDHHHVTEASKPHQWQTDEASVRAGTCSFPVKYLGCVEVYESRGMQVCEEALKVLRPDCNPAWKTLSYIPKGTSSEYNLNSRRRPLRGMLYVSGDGLRVVDDETKGLIVDQTIEKVSFCAPDRNHEKGFSYICRDGTTRRWMCHGFIAVKETPSHKPNWRKPEDSKAESSRSGYELGERLSHAVGCAFAACLERKQKRDKECGVTMTFDPNTSTFTRTGSFRQMTVTERLSDPQECKPIEPVPVKKVENPHAIARPHATPLMLQRQGSFRVFQHLGQSSPFKRQLSLRLNELPSNLERTRSMSLDNSTANSTTTNNNNQPPESPQPPPRTQRNRLHSLPNAVNMTPIPESSPMVENKAGDAVSAMCQELSAGLSLLSNFSDPFAASPDSGSPTQNSYTKSVATSYTNVASTEVTSHPGMPPVPQGVLLPSVNPIREENPWSGSAVNGQDSGSDSGVNREGGFSRGEEWLSQINSQSTITNGTTTPPLGNQEGSNTVITRRNPPLSQLRSASLGATPNTPTSTQHVSINSSARDPMSSSWTTSNGTSGTTTADLIGGAANSTSSGTAPGPGDPFDAEWAALAARNANPNNPFLPSTVTKAFEVQM